jgi:hypothetical protein
MTERDDYAELERLLPFYINGTIEPAARLRLDAALAGSAPLRAALEEERLNQAHLVAGVESELAAAEAGSGARNAKLHLRLGEPARAAPAPAGGGLIAALGFLNPRRWHPAVALSLAAALPLQGWLIAGKNDVIGQLRNENFELASGPCEDRPKAGAVQLELADGAKWADVAALLDTENLSIAKSGDFGVLTVKTGKQGAELAALIVRLKASALVASAEPAA